jgi:hypothetical protein
LSPALEALVGESCGERCVRSRAASLVRVWSDFSASAAERAGSPPNPPMRAQSHAAFHRRDLEQQLATFSTLCHGELSVTTICMEGVAGLRPRGARSSNALPTQHRHASAGRGGPLSVAPVEPPRHVTNSTREIPWSSVAVARNVIRSSPATMVSVAGDTSSTRRRIRRPRAPPVRHVGDRTIRSVRDHA